MITNLTFGKNPNLVEGGVNKEKLDASIAPMNAIYRWMCGKKILPQHSATNLG